MALVEAGQKRAIGPFALAILNLATILPRPLANGPGDEIRSVNSVSMWITGTITRKAKSEAKSFSSLRVLQVDFRRLRRKYLYKRYFFTANL